MSTLSKLLKSFLKQRTAYLTDSLYRFSESNSKLYLAEENGENTAHKAPVLLIIGREHYFETSKLYPISNKSEVRKAALLEDISAPYEGKRLVNIQKVDEQSHRVTFWVIPNTIMANYAYTVKVILPESFLWANSVEENNKFLQIESSNRSLFVYNSFRKLSSGLFGLGIKSLEEFALVSGLPQPDGQELVITENNRCDHILNGLRNISIGQWPNFLLSADGLKKSKFPWRAVISTSLLSGLVYLLLTSGWVIYKDIQLNAALESQKTAVNDALSNQKDYQQLKQLNSLLAEPLSQQEPHWRIWLVVDDIISTGATIRTIDYRYQKVTIDGRAAKGEAATGVLELMTKNSLIHDAHFVKPISRSLGYETFSIQFTFVPDAVFENEKTTDSSSKDSQESMSE